MQRGNVFQLTATHGRALFCLAMTAERLDELQLPAMVPENTALGSTAFTISIDLRRHGVTTVISAQDRAATIQAAIDAKTKPQDFARPGHVLPLRAHPGGVLERRVRQKLRSILRASPVCTRRA